MNKNKNLFFLSCTILSVLSFPVHADNDFFHALANAAIERTKHSIIYDGSYHNIPYPMGDVPAHIGVCTDVVIRAYRSLGIDLQKHVHEDMHKNFSTYPAKRIWGQTQPDRNIDHRRVPNLEVFFSRFGTHLNPSKNAADYHAGDIISWMLPGNLPHIGIVSHIKDKHSGRPLIVHNIGSGPQLEDVLFAYPLKRHFRYRAEKDKHQTSENPSTPTH